MSNGSPWSLSHSIGVSLRTAYCCRTTLFDCTLLLALLCKAPLISASLEGKNKNLNLSDDSSYSLDKVKNLSGLFCGCAKITKVPDLSRWNTSKVKDFSGMFFSCSKLLSLPDISKWSTHNVKNMTGMFGDCVMLSSLPDLSKWSLNKKVLVVNMFKGCREDLKIPKKFRKVNDVDEGDKESQE